MDKLRKGRPVGDEATPIHHYFSQSSPDSQERNACECLRSVILQLLSSSDNESLWTEAEKKWAIGPSSNVKILRIYTELAIGAINERNLTHIFIDAIDECDPSQQDALIQSLQLIVKHSLSTVKIFVTSRYDKRLSALFSQIQGLSEIPVGAVENGPDIQQYVLVEVAKVVANQEQRMDCAFDDPLKATIKEYLLANSQGRSVRVPVQCRTHLRERKSLITRV